jgi:hypothetical protein
VIALLPLEAGAVKLTEAVPAVAPATTLTSVGAPGALVELPSPPHAARDMPSTTGSNNLIMSINIFLFLRQFLQSNTC